MGRKANSSREQETPATHIVLRVGEYAARRAQGDPARDLREEFSRLGHGLAEFELPPHEEPETLPEGEGESSFLIAHPNGLHLLRRLALHLWAHDRLPAPGGDEDLEDPLFGDYYDCLVEPEIEAFWERARKNNPHPNFEHLLVHSDHEGWHIPADMPEVLQPSEEAEVPGELIGSIPRLIDECSRIAQALEIPEGLSHDDPGLVELALEEAERPKGGSPKYLRYGPEAQACATCLHAARRALASGAGMHWTTGNPEGGMASSMDPDELDFDED